MFQYRRQNVRGIPMRHLWNCKLHFDKSEKWKFLVLLYRFSESAKGINKRETICIREKNGL